MTLFAVEGVAGCGKTFRLMEVLSQFLGEHQWQDGHRILALTFMHGARRRLDERLQEVALLGRRFQCATIDSFSFRLLQRWRSLANVIGIPPFASEDFDAQCDAAGALLERAEVRAWTAASFPIVLVDEAQDLKPQRLRVIRALAQSTTMLIAADEFQCLDAALRPNPLIEWIRATCAPELLTTVRRTDVPALLAASAAIRAGNAPAAAGNLRIFGAQGLPMAAAYVANAVAWRQGGRVAVITPSLQGNFARNVVQRVCERPCGSQGNGPFPIRWERYENEEAAQAIEHLDLDDVSSIGDALTALDRLPEGSVVHLTKKWIRRQSSVSGRVEFSRAEIESVIARQVAIRRQRYGVDTYDLLAMTVQQAKNREFDGVIVLWPYQVGGDAEHKRRLLYNAVTRARRWCTIVAQNPQILTSPPFS